MDLSEPAMYFATTFIMSFLMMENSYHTFAACSKATGHLVKS